MYGNCAVVGLLHHPFWLQHIFVHILDITIQLLKLPVFDLGSVMRVQYPKMCLWSILLIKSYLRWCIHLIRSLFLCRLRSIAAHRDHFVRRLSVRLSGSHTFLVVTHSYVSQATHAFLGMLPLCLYLNNKNNASYHIAFWYFLSQHRLSFECISRKVYLYSWITRSISWNH